MSVIYSHGLSSRTSGQRISVDLYLVVPRLTQSWPFPTETHPWLPQAGTAFQPLLHMSYVAQDAFRLLRESAVTRWRAVKEGSLWGGRAGGGRGLHKCTVWVGVGVVGEGDGCGRRLG